MAGRELRFRVAVMAVAIFGGSALAGCCGGPFSASDDDCTGPEPKCTPKPDAGDAGCPSSDASTD